MQRAFEKIRQDGRGSPAVMIRQLDALAQIASRTDDPARRGVLLEQAEMIKRSALESIPEGADLQDVLRRYRVMAQFRTEE
ncbi:hypothetical protein [Nocardia seriolae]|uniref:Uncharacterized protein n=1 Tax=Nocardia seriolae TaxID=37332 RepID=A0ABC9Z488_9NOCA|nr:hypothetical protein [Nocardia seriolae]GEM28122.1 hypothetical protein NS2_63610 [Nocardia seriolae NBRC 15557]BEK86236.1 hypothetical protein NSERKGN1266_21870 [Nocardia seriolae]BEK97831.1 hypothetical protein NSER024013_57370 [Nocardia seriolae]GAM50385.1 hypothetical protein NS07_v2contig00150-0014 [Nocardia seriolae]GAP32336.1 hypothetical protein NSK11_contig00152-0015 [Nocardia seriolae]